MASVPNDKKVVNNEEEEEEEEEEDNDNRILDQPPKYSKSSSSFWFYLMVIIFVAEGFACYMFHRHIIQDNDDIIANLKENAFFDQQIIQNMADEKSILLRNLQEARKRYDDIESLYEKLKESTDNASKKGSKSEQESARKKENCGASESEEDKKKAKEANEWDDHDDSVYCWLDGFFNSNFFTTPEECNKQKQKKLACPFKSAQDAIKHLQLHPKFVELQKTKRKSKERRKLINALSLEFHPDKLLAFGCPAGYGQDAQAMINEYR